MSLIKPAYAIIENPVLKSNPTNGFTYINSVLKTFIELLFIFGLIYFFLHFILAGYKIIASQGDSKKYEEGMAALRNSLIGIVVVFMVFAVIYLLAYMFDINITDGSITWPTL